MRAKRISISAARSGIGRILVWVKSGREFIVCRAGTPIVRLVRPTINGAVGKNIVRSHRAKALPSRLARGRFRNRSCHASRSPKVP